ncbi:phytase [Sphingomonas sp.]|uniref:phytase n=1 Tax=Sphingomonas sp. TaxID=28214 RepID=UPI001B23C406|nr:phytase [Sphingomonas sp.]MBO9713843.1 phytase [Sphingomonas sp.]
MLPALLLMLAESGPETKSVQAIAETQAVASAKDAADDPAIWRNPRDPAKSLIVATDKQAGLNVYTLDGKLVSSIAAGRMNNVDLRGVGGRVIVAASDRNDKAHAKLALFELDTTAGTLAPIGRYDVGAGEGYGLCMYAPRSGGLSAFVVDKDGTIAQMAIAFDAAGAHVARVRTMKLATQSEGCVADDRTGDLFVAEEDSGIWKFAADADAPREGKKIAEVDSARLFADAEGLAIAARGARGGWLVASSQGDSAYAVWKLPSLEYAGRFRIAAGKFGATSDTDGIEIATASFGKGREGGLMIAQDGDNSPSAQNFKIVRWADVVKALGLK